MKNNPRIIIIGASFAGLRALSLIRKKLPKARITLIDKEKFFTYIPSLHLCLNDNHYGKKIRFSYAQRYKKYYKNELVTKVDKKQVHTKTGSHDYDYCIIACGAQPNFFGKKSIRDSTYPARTLQDIQKINNRLPSVKNIIVVGGGVTGVEYTAILATTTNKKVTLLTSSDKLTPLLSESASKYTLNYLEKNGVKVLLNRKAVEATKYSVLLEDGTQMDSDLTIWCAGLKQKPPFSVDGAQFKVFYAGDVQKTHLWPTAHNAMLDGDIVARKIIARSKGTRKHFHSENWTSLAVALGRKRGFIAIGRRKIAPSRFTGFSKWLLEKRILFEFKYKIRLWI